MCLTAFRAFELFGVWQELCAELFRLSLEGIQGGNYNFSCLTLFCVILLSVVECN